MDLLLSVAKITSHVGDSQRIRLNQDNMNVIGVQENDFVLIIHAQHSTQAGAIVGIPLPSRDNHIVLDVVSRYALGALEGHQVRVMKSQIESATSVTVTPRRRWKMPVKELDIRHILQERIVALRQRVPLIKHGIWLDFEVTSIVPETQLIRVTRNTQIIVKSLVEKITPSNLIRNAVPPTEDLPDPVLDATGLFREINPTPQILLFRPNHLPPPPNHLPPQLHTAPDLRTISDPTQIPPETRKYYQETWGFDPIAVLKSDGAGYAYEAEIPLANDPHLLEAGVTMFAQTHIPSGASRAIFEWNMNNIVFRCGSQEARASCVHTIIQKGSLEDAFNLTDAIERGEVFPRRGSLARLDPLEHFAALRSYCHAIAEMGILRGIESTINFEDNDLRGELAFGFNSSLQRQIMNALTIVAPTAVSRQLREIILWNVDKAPGNWLQGPGGKLFARRMSLANFLFSDPDIAPQILQILQAKGMPLPADGDEKRKVAVFFGITGNHPNRPMRDAIMQELRELFERRAVNRDDPERIEELRRRIAERLNAFRDRPDRNEPEPAPPGPPPSPPPPPPRGNARNQPKARNPRRSDDDDLNFFAI